VGFEPTVAFRATHALQACLLDHSSTSPYTGQSSGGEGGIRTHAPAKRRPLFESGTMNHSVTSPESELYRKPLFGARLPILEMGGFTARVTRGNRKNGTGAD
jgi:hypothetical protein